MVKHLLVDGVEFVVGAVLAVLAFSALIAFWYLVLALVRTMLTGA